MTRKRAAGAVVRRPRAVPGDTLRAELVTAILRFETSGGSRAEAVSLCLSTLAEVGAQGVAAHAVQRGTAAAARALAELLAGMRRR